MEKITFTEKYYDKDYFVTPGGKKCILPDGTTKEWSYANPSGDWHGTAPIIKAWKDVFNPKKMLDVGAGRGVFLGYAQEMGVDAIGFDFSDFAVGEGRFFKCEEGTLIKHDVTERFPYLDNSFDFVVCLDLMEHIYEEDVSSVIDELYRVCNKYVFLQISTAEDVNFSLLKNKEIPDKYREFTLTGHVLIKNKDWWKKKLERNDWKFNQEKVDDFFKAVKPPITSDCAWATNLIAVMEKNA